MFFEVAAVVGGSTGANAKVSSGDDHNAKAIADASMAWEAGVSVGVGDGPGVGQRAVLLLIGVRL